MLTSFVAVFCSLVVLSLGAVCTPDQWEGQLFRFAINIDLRENGKAPQVTKRRVDNAYDATNNRYSQIFYNDPSSTPIDQGLYIYDGKKTICYSIDFVKNTCESMVHPGPLPRYCIPDDARYIGTTNYGLDKVFATQVYNETSIGNGYQKSTVKKIDKNTFVPVLDILYAGNKNYVFTETQTTYNMVRGIKNTTVFNVPKICDKAVPKQIELPMPQHPFHAGFARLHKD